MKTTSKSERKYAKQRYPHICRLMGTAVTVRWVSKFGYIPSEEALLNLLHCSHWEDVTLACHDIINSSIDAADIIFSHGGISDNNVPDLESSQGWITPNFDESDWKSVYDWNNM